MTGEERLRRAVDVVKQGLSDASWTDSIPEDAIAEFRKEQEQLLFPVLWGTNHMANVVDDAARYMAAKRVSFELDPEASAEAETSRLKVVAGPIRLPSKDANPIFIKSEVSLSSGSDLIARRVANRGTCCPSIHPPCHSLCPGMLAPD